MKINNNIFSNSINNIVSINFNSINNNINNIKLIDSLLLSSQNLDYLLLFLLMSLRNILNTFNNNFSPFSMNAIGNFVNLVNNLIGGFGNLIGGFGNPIGGFDNPIRGFGNPIGGFGNPIRGFGNPIGGVGNPNVSNPNVSNSSGNVGNPGFADLSNKVNPLNTNSSNNPKEEYSLDLIKQFEGFSPKAYWDYTRYSIGYGTAANSPNEVITQEEAERRMKEHIDKEVLPGIKGIIGEDRWNQLSYSQKSALVSLAYNLGVPGSREILKLVRDGKIEEAAQEMKKYVHADGKVLEGLVRRRNEEAKWLLNSNGNNDDSNKTDNKDSNIQIIKGESNSVVNNKQEVVNNKQEPAASSVSNLVYNPNDQVKTNLLGYSGRGPIFNTNRSYI
jgi:GH24 family phage-related lysozyme (muramidase)